MVTCLASVCPVQRSLKSWWKRLSRETPGKRLLPVVIDQIAAEDPNRVFLFIPSQVDSREGCRAITYGEFSRAIDRMAEWIESTFGMAQGFPAAAFISRPYDFRYLIIWVAGMKTGFKFLLPSPRNSIENQLHLFEKTQCKIIVSDISLGQLMEASGCRVFSPPPLDDLLAKGRARHFPFRKTYDECKDQPAGILHSSGSTGPPKPITWTHGFLAAIDAYSQSPAPGDAKRGLDLYKSKPGTTHLVTLPLFHAAGILFALLANVFFGATHMILSEKIVPTAENLGMLLRTFQLDSILAAPSILEGMAKSPETIEQLRRMKFVAFAGAPLSQVTSQFLCEKGVFLYPSIGSTETGPFPQYLASRKDALMYQRWPMSVPGIKFRQRQDDLYELVFERCQWNLAVFETFPNLTEYPTKDLYRRHPELPDHWLYVVRADDVVVLSSGEKLVPIPMEDALNRAPAVLGALVTGSGRFQTAAVVEFDPLQASEWSQADKLVYLEPYLDEANKVAPSQAWLSTSRIVFAETDKPMVRSSKGAVVRGQTLKLYSAEIERTYEDEISDVADEMDTDDEEEIRTSLLVIIKSFLQSGCELDINADFFQKVGLDSTKVIELSRKIRRRLQGRTPKKAKLVSPKLIYDNSTVSSLSSAIKVLGEDKLALDTSTRPQGVEEMIAKFSDGLTQKSPVHIPRLTSKLLAEGTASPSYFDSGGVSRTMSVASSSSNTVMSTDSMPSSPELADDDLEKSLSIITRECVKQNVILTGSTGSLGSYILDILISDNSVGHVFALNRSSDAENRQHQSSMSRGLSADFSKVTFLQIDTGEPSLGLPDSQLRSMLARVSLIIHNAWPVNFNKSLQSFISQVAGVRNLINFSALAERQPQILFVSSIGTTGNWGKLHRGDGGVPEEIIEDAQVPLDQGYSQSKYASEHILAAAVHAGVSSTICRVGQIAGPVERSEGEWNQHEWLPSLVKSSGHLGVLPETLGPDEAGVDWIPVDRMARIIVELGMHGTQSGQDEATARFFNLVNKEPVSWRSLLPAVQKRLPVATRVVPFSEWLETLRKSGEDGKVSLSKNPGLKLMGFWEDMDRGSCPSGLRTEKAVEASRTMREMQGVSSEWMDRWMEQWGFSPRS